MAKSGHPKGTCGICGGSGTIQVQRVVAGKTIRISVPCPANH